MTEIDKTALERYLFDSFRLAYADFPKGRIVQSESPDFLIQISPKTRIGIEITSYYDHNYTELSWSTISKSIRLKREKLNTLISKKEEKLAFYRKKKFKELWLLITVMPLSDGQLHQIPTNITNWKINSGFDKVFLFQAESGKLIEFVEF